MKAEMGPVGAGLADVVMWRLFFHDAQARASDAQKPTIRLTRAVPGQCRMRVNVGNARERRREVGAAIEVEAAQEILVRLALALCCVTMTLGTASRTSPSSISGRATDAVAARCRSLPARPASPRALH